MVKLASARESRTYGPGSRLARTRWEYINAGLYLFATALLVGGFAAQISPVSSAGAKSGLVAVLAALALLLAVNAHDLVAHLAAVDYCLSLVEFDVQLALVEFAVPLMNTVGVILTFVGILFFLIQMEKGYSYRLEKHALNTLIAGPIFWVIGSIHNVCQIYERADGHVQLLQNSVQVPLIMGSLLFLVAGIVNKHYETLHMLMGRSWVWLCLSGSSLFLVGGLMNTVRVFKMQRTEGSRLEKLRGSAYERLAKGREELPLILESSKKSRKQQEEGRPASAPTSVPTPYKDALLGSLTRSIV
ncbi:hypothetical protein MUK42_20732 [Musa troglodytarum]|uniref:Uncharacterized protein n=1 Tax=Musa troglodytarum TaxID=320322 RepID=A0A9E7G5D2_9LILI|nr:hypothetical protein MUK42_20732 [Musa troglodytarum]